jgi:uncharacterized 2Fe-2S/4Fe-4S cluster protein (DUF4445 family)
VPLHPVTFAPSGRSALVPQGASILDAAGLAGEPLAAECGGRGACGRCLVRVESGEVPEYRVVRREAGSPHVLACLTPVHGPLTVSTLEEARLPRLISRDRDTGVAPLQAWAPWPLDLDPIAPCDGPEDLGVALDLGTTTLRLVLVRLSDGVIVGEAGSYNPQIARGADVISRIVAAEKGGLGELAALVRGAVRSLVEAASRDAGVDMARIRGYVVAGNLTMVHLLVEADPSGIRRVPSQPGALGFDPASAAALEWPGAPDALVRTIPAAGGWVGGDILAGVVRAGLPRVTEGLSLYVDLGTNGEIVLGGSDFALACACSAGPAFEGVGIRCGMRADRGAVDGAAIDEETGALRVSVIGGGVPRGVCGSGLIALADSLFRAGWIDRGGRFTRRLPASRRSEGQWGAAVALSPDGRVSLWERDLESLIRSKAAVFSGIRALEQTLGPDRPAIGQVIVSGNFGRYLNLPAALGIGLLPTMPLDRYGYVGNGSLEGAALVLLSRAFSNALAEYLARITYVDLADLPGYIDEFVAASFLPHTSLEALQIE